MKAKKFLALSMAAAMVLSMAACGEEEASGSSVEQSSEESSSESSSVVESSEESSEAQSGLEVGEVSINFEDGLFGFMGLDTSVASAKADKSLLELASYGGSQALKVTPQGATPYIGMQVDALLGDAAADVKTVEMTIGIENPDGNFAAASGKMYAFLGEDNARNEAAWSVYLENANPKRVTYTVPEGQSFGAGNYMVISLETDTGKDKGATPANMYIDDIAFKDASGKTLTVDTSAEFAAVSTAVDRSNLYALKNAVNFEGFATTGGGWSQAGFAMTPEIIAALKPGAVVEISYESDNGDLWIVMNEAAAGWSRVGAGVLDGKDTGMAVRNSEGNICQITYEQIAAICGEDVSTWGSTMQCEASGNWEVLGVKVGEQAPAYALENAVKFEGFATTGGGWSQAGFAMTPEIIEALVPGSVVEISYTSDNGDIWIVMNEAAAGWSRVGAGVLDGKDTGMAVRDGSKCYITYEQIAAICGEDVSTWGSTMQCEASGNWEVMGIKVGKAAEFAALNNLVNFEGFATTGGGWSQAGFAMTPEIIEALKPGAVVTIQYASDNGDLWIVMNEAAAGWSRVGAGVLDGKDTGMAVRNGSTCQITYEQIAAICGEDVSTWGSTMQCEASGNWEVFSVKVGTAQ